MWRSLLVSFFAAAVSLVLAAASASAQQWLWRSGPPMPGARSEIHAALLGNCIYVAGGLAGRGTSAAFDCLDLGASVWRRLAALPEAVHHAPVAAGSGKIWLAGGYINVSFAFNEPMLWSYDPATDRWSTAARLPGRRAAHVMAVIGNALFIAAGTGDRPQEVWSYDLATGSWRADHAPLPRRIEHAAGLAHAGRLWIFGGRWSGEGEFNTVFAYDPARNVWERAPDMPEPRGGHAAAVLGGTAYILGGERLSDGSVDAEALLYDFAARRWTKALRVASPRIPRHGLAAAAAGNCLWVIGGGKEAGWRTFFTAADETEQLCR